MPRIIAIAGLAGSGKSTISKMLTHQHGFKLVKFADPLKNALRAIGLTEEELEGSRKALPCKLLGGRTPRYAMQTLGTEWGRNLIHDGLWTNIWKSRVKDLLADNHPVICDDCRFENEVEAVQALGGEIWEVRRRAASEAKLAAPHASEAGIAARFASQRLMNNGSIDELFIKVNELLNKGI